MPAPSKSTLTHPAPSRRHALALSGAEYYGRNLAALQAVQPAVALFVDAIPIPHGIEEAVGRDGTRTLLLTDDAGGRAWFGGSSTPAVSASEMFSNLSGDGGNVSQPGILTGIEPLVITERLAAHCAVFVVEESPLHLKLALHLYNYSALLTSGRLVFLLGDNVSASLIEFFEHHSGYTLPTQMFTVPQRSPAQIAKLQRQFEQVGEAVLGVQARVVESCAEAIRRRMLGRLPAMPHVALLSVDPNAAALEQAQRIKRALDGLQWPCEVCVPDAPNRCHIAARIQAIERVSADLVLFLNGFPNSLRPLLPIGLPIAAWYQPGASATAPTPSAIGRHDLLVASSKPQHDLLVSAGIPLDAVVICEPAADDKTFHPTASRADEHAPIAVLMDLPDDRPESCGINLPSHVALWQALREATRRQVDRYDDEMAEEVFEVAQRSSGTVLNEPATREQFLNLLRTRIAPAALAQSSMNALLAEGCEVAIWGMNWPAMDKETDPRRGPMPHGELLNKILNATGAIVLPWMSPTGVQLALDALAAGATVILHTSEGSLLTEHPGLSSVVRFLSFYRTRSELTDAVRRMRSQGEARRQQAEAAVAEIQANHSVTGRLVALVDCLRDRRS